MEIFSSRQWGRISFSNFLSTRLYGIWVEASSFAFNASSASSICLREKLLIPIYLIFPSFTRYSIALMVSEIFTLLFGK
jgi:hypothetical protein